MTQYLRTKTTRPMPRGGALLPAGERGLGRCQRQRWQSGWRRD